MTSIHKSWDRHRGTNGLYVVSVDRPRHTTLTVRGDGSYAALEVEGTTVAAISPFFGDSCLRRSVSELLDELESTTLPSEGEM